MPWPALAVLALTYGVAGLFMVHLTSEFSYTLWAASLHLGLLTAVILGGLSVVLLVHRRLPRRVDPQTVCAALLTAIPIVLILVYGSCYLSNSSWGENMTIWILIAQARGVQIDWTSILPYPKLVMMAGAVALVVVGVSIVSFRTYRSLWPFITRLAESSPLARLTMPLLTLVLGVLLGWEAQANPWKWYGEPLANFVGWPPVSSTMGFDAIRTRAALDAIRTTAELEDLGEGRAYVPGSGLELRNVILIIVDSLRADHMGVYGYERDTTPFLSSLDRAGKLHKVHLALSTCSESYCGIATILASRHFHQVSPLSFKLFDVLGRAGYRNRFFLAGDHRNWYHLQDFYAAARQDIYDFEATKRFHPQDDRLVLEGLRTLPPFEGQPHFIYTFLMSAHVIGARRNEFDRWLPTIAPELALVAWTNKIAPSSPKIAGAVNYYDNGVGQADAVIREIFEILETKGYLRNSVVVVTADHGDGLGEHGHYGHSRYLYQEDIHVPLLIYDPEPARYRNGVFATHVDIAPTIVQRLGLATPRTWVGRSLLEPEPKEFSLHQTRRGKAICRAIVRRPTPATWKYIRCGDQATGSEELYDLARDPGERDNVVSRAEPAVLQGLRRQLDESFSISVNHCPFLECQ